jgi:hypothetical protein
MQKERNTISQLCDFQPNASYGIAPHPPAGTFSPLKRGEGICGNVSAPSAFSPPAGRRWRQPDEGQSHAKRSTAGDIIRPLWQDAQARLLDFERNHQNSSIVQLLFGGV